MAKTLGQQIRALREKRGLVQVDLASRVGVREVSISRWERDLEIPRVQHLIALAKALDCRILLDDSGAHIAARTLPDERRLPALQPLRDAINRLQALGALTLGQWADDAVELAHRYLGGGVGVS
jgi:transcriptional regulator with XRE-family HTH domain